ncbi:sodium/proline symporter PutP [Qipengyuania sediminis]|uniref:sodium/proline symporter PutP n=1 Tax=Qipengyuania sediminis TaxID=1532023 RepID=UPI00105A5B92|nr:sodium/proline symporter PutP [Qipengyuania sediminis]
MDKGTIVSLSLYFAAMLAIGIYAWRKTAGTSEGFLLAGRDLSPSVTALSAGASDMSGWLLLGLPGALYLTGLSAAWIAIGLVLGAWANWLVVAPRLRAQSEARGNALTIPEFLANRFPDKALALRVVSAIVIVVFFAVYTASGLVGGGKLFESALAPLLPTGTGLSPYMLGVIVTAAVVLIYVALGGFLAVSLTDVVQGTIMFVALVAMPLVILLGPGGEAVRATRVEVPGFLSLTQGLSLLGVISAVTWGLGYFGQPHIIVRFMAIRRVEDMPAARRIGMSWMIVCLLGAIGVGLAGRAYAQANGIAVTDPETIFIVLSDLLFHPIVTGFLFAALLAAIMSTVSSQLLVTSSSLTEDFYRLFLRKQAGEREAVNASRVFLVLISGAAIFIAADPSSEVLGLVAHAWAGFGAAFGPLMILALTWDRMTGAGAVAGLVTGAAVAAGWIALGWDQALPGMAEGLYEIVPAFAAAWVAIIVVSRMTQPAATPAR